MKNMNVLKMIPVLMPALFVMACDGYKKNPVSDISTMRDEAKTQTTQGPQKPEVITNTIYVPKTEVQTVAQATVDGKFIVITPDPQMTFSEGQTSSYNIRARVLKPGVKVTIVPDGKRDDIRLDPSAKEEGLFVLTWTPPAYTVPTDAATKIISFKLRPKVLSADDPADVEKFNGLVSDQTITLIVTHNQEKPSNIQVNGLDTSVNEGDIVTITVTAKVPGADGQAAIKPILNHFYDRQAISPGNAYQEQDGTRYVSGNIGQNTAEYVDNFVWKFTETFDTKNIGVLPQMSKEGKLVKSDATNVRLSFFVTSPMGMRTSDILKQVKIVHTKSVTAAKFNLLGLAQQSLEVSRGQKVNLKFTVDSANTSAHVFAAAQESDLPGAPQVICKTAKAGANTQNCLLSWNVPCDIPVDKLKGAINMTATSSSPDQLPEETSYALSVIPAVKEADLCAPAKADVKPAAPATTPATAAAPATADPAAPKAADTKPVVKTDTKPAPKPATKPTVKTGVLSEPKNVPTPTAKPVAPTALTAKKVS